MTRVKHNTTATNIDTLVAVFYDPSFSYYPDGSFLERGSSVGF